MRIINVKIILQKILKEAILFTFLYYGTNFIPGPHFHSSLHNHADIKQISLFDAFYFSLITQTTVGYGDITARSVLAKFLTCCQLIGLLFIASEEIIL